MTSKTRAIATVTTTRYQSGLIGEGQPLLVMGEDSSRRPSRWPGTGAHGSGHVWVENEESRGSAGGSGAGVERRDAQSSRRGKDRAPRNAARAPPHFRVRAPPATAKCPPEPERTSMDEGPPARPRLDGQTDRYRAHPSDQACSSTTPSMMFATSSQRSVAFSRFS